MINSKNRFKGHKSLNFVYRHGKILRGPMFAIKYIDNPKRQEWRLAVVVSKKVEPSAVTRNRIRRRVYEIVRKNTFANVKAVDMVITIFDTNIAELDHPKLENNIKEVLTTVYRP